jgi:hypothetical protein
MAGRHHNVRGDPASNLLNRFGLQFIALGAGAVGAIGRSVCAEQGIRSYLHLTGCNNTQIIGTKPYSTELNSYRTYQPLFLSRGVSFSRCERVYFAGHLGFSIVLDE